VTDQNLSDEAARFEVVLDELRVIMVELRRIGVHAVLVGGQVLAVERRENGGTGVVEVRTPTDVAVNRGFSLEPDLLIDADQAGERVHALGDALRNCNFKRVNTARWYKKTHAGDVFLDIFIPAEADPMNDPGAVRLPQGEAALLKPRNVKLQLKNGILEIDVPDPVGFLAMKLEAKLRLRPTETKDSFDIYAYVAMKGAQLVAKAIQDDHFLGADLKAKLQQLFGDINAPGVTDVLTFAGGLAAEERDLLARAAVDLFAEITG